MRNTPLYNQPYRPIGAAFNLDRTDQSHVGEPGGSAGGYAARINHLVQASGHQFTKFLIRVGWDLAHATAFTPCSWIIDQGAAFLLFSRPYRSARHFDFRASRFNPWKRAKFSPKMPFLISFVSAGYPVGNS